MLADKVRSVAGTGAEVCAAADSSCLLQIGGGLSRAGSAVRTAHLAEILPRPRSERRLPGAAHEALGDAQLRRNLGSRPTRSGRSAPRVVAERAGLGGAPRGRPGAQGPRPRGTWTSYLLQFEAAVERAGGHVHWARDGEEADRIVAGLVRATGEREVVKVKSLTTDEIRLNDALAAVGIDVVETDLAELICQLAGEESSHILVPAIHKNRVEIRDLFREKLGLPDLSDEPRRAGRGGPRSTCASASSGPASRSAAPTSQSRRPARSASSSRRATAASARPCPGR